MKTFESMVPYLNVVFILNVGLFDPPWTFSTFPFKMHPGELVSPFKMHLGGTIPPYKMHPGGTLNFSDNF